MKLSEKNARISAMLIAAAPTVGAAVYASTMTTVVLGTTAAAGAIATKTIMVNGSPAVLSLVKASLLSKLLVIGVFGFGSLLIAGMFYRYATTGSIKWTRTHKDGSTSNSNENKS